MKWRKFVWLTMALFLLPLLSAAAATQDAVTHIHFSEDGITIEGEGAAAYGSVVTVYSGGTYMLGGELRGQLIVDTQKNNGDVTLILDNARILCSEGPAIWIEKATSCRLVLNEDTVNELSAEKTGECALFADEQLIIEGTGSLNINSAGGDGVLGRKNLAIYGGVLTVQADRRGLHTRKLMEIDGGVLTVSAGRKGLSAKDGMTISGGKIQILAGGDGISVGKRGDQYKEGAGVLTLSEGEINIDAYKAPIDAWGGMTVLGGSCFGTGRTDKHQSISSDSTQATVIKTSQGEPGERVCVENEESVLAEARPHYAYDLVFFTDETILRGFQYTVTSPDMSGLARAQ